MALSLPWRGSQVQLVPNTGALEQGRVIRRWRADQTEGDGQGEVRVSGHIQVPNSGIRDRSRSSSHHHFWGQCNSVRARAQARKQFCRALQASPQRRGIILREGVPGVRWCPFKLASIGACQRSMVKHERKLTECSSCLSHYQCRIICEPRPHLHTRPTPTSGPPAGPPWPPHTNTPRFSPIHPHAPSQHSRPAAPAPP